MAHTLRFIGSGEGVEVIQRNCEKTLHFGGSGKGTESKRTREIMTGMCRRTPIRRKSTPLGDVQGKVSRPIFYFFYFVDDLVFKTHDYSEVKKEVEQSDNEYG